jgi:hypothetical protein
MKTVIQYLSNIIKIQKEKFENPTFATQVNSIAFFKMSHTLLSSPLQGFTDFRFRNAFNKYFGGIDTFYAPYIRLNGKLEIKSVYERDLLPSDG